MSFCKDIYDMLSRKYPNSKIYLISDQHFCHQNIINYTRNNFKSIDEMNEHIINSHNQTISNDDIVIFLGDFSFKNPYIKEVLGRLNGHKYLLLGNHDPESLIKNYPSLGLEGVFKGPIKLGDNYLSHQPLIEGEVDTTSFKLIVNEFKKCSNSLNYHGHIHERAELDPKYKNVTCEVLDYKPILVGVSSSITEDKPLFINSKYFSKALDELREKYRVNQQLAIKDYIYSQMLESLQSHKDEYFVQGSYGLYKKYGFISDISDLDITFLYNLKYGKNCNIAHLKQMADESYEKMKGVDRIDISFIKRYSSLRIFEALYTSENPYHVNCYFDSNLIFLDSYKSTDFKMLNGISLIQRLLAKDNRLMTEEFEFPKFQTQFLVPEADMANLILQYLFQMGNDDKKAILLKKMQYLYKHVFNNKEMENFEDIFVRFFLRNIALLYTLCRYEEIEYIQKLINNLKELAILLPDYIRTKVESFMMHDSLFQEVCREISSVEPNETLAKGSQIIKRYFK